MTYETVASLLFEAFPDIECFYETQFPTEVGEPPLNYIVFGSALIPVLEKALTDGNDALVSSICAFLEEASRSAQSDPRLAELLLVEIGEWLGGTAREEQLSPFLGSETKRVCRYVPGLATQRWKLRVEQQTSSLKHRIGSIFKGR